MPLIEWCTFNNKRLPTNPTFKEVYGAYDDSAKKVIYLAIQNTDKKWTMPIRNWKPAVNRFIIEFEDRLTDYI